MKKFVDKNCGGIGDTETVRNSFLGMVLVKTGSSRYGLWNMNKKSCYRKYSFDFGTNRLLFIKHNHYL